MRNLIYSLLTICVISNAYSQEVISTAGGNSTMTDRNICWTLGEAFVITLGNSEIVLTQGFQQTPPLVNNTVENADYKCRVSVFPNPFSDHLRISMEKAEQHSYTYRITNMYGTVIKQGELTDDVCEIPTSSLPAAVYILNIETDNGNSKKVKIIKY